MGGSDQGRILEPSKRGKKEEKEERGLCNVLKQHPEFRKGEGKGKNPLARGRLYGTKREGKGGITA